MEREQLLQEYEATLNSLIEKTKFVYSEKFFALDDFEKQNYQRDKTTTEGHLSTLCNLLWSDKNRASGGFSDLFPLMLISTMFGSSGLLNSSGSTTQQKALEDRAD